MKYLFLILFSMPMFIYSFPSKSFKDDIKCLLERQIRLEEQRNCLLKCQIRTDRFNNKFGAAIDFVLTKCNCPDPFNYCIKIEDKK